MCGIDELAMRTKPIASHRNGGRVLGWVPPFHGRGDCFGASSQGVALGFRLSAPLAREQEDWRKTVAQGLAQDRGTMRCDALVKHMS